MSMHPNILSKLPRSVLLLGGSGFLGSNLGQALMDHGCRVIVLDRIKPKWNAEVYADRGTYIPGLVSDLETVIDILEANPIDAVVHMASSLLPASSLEDVCVDLSGSLVPSLRLLELLSSKGIHRFVYLSSGGAVYGPHAEVNHETDPLHPLSYYGWTKLVFEEFIRLQARRCPLQYLILRPSNPYGRYQNLRGRQGLISVVFGRILDRLPLEVWGDGMIVRDFLYIDDFCRAILALMARPQWNETYNIGSGEGSSVNEIIRLAREITGLPLDVIQRPSRIVDTPSTILDISRLRSIFTDPFLGLESGMERYWNELQRNPHP